VRTNDAACEAILGDAQRKLQQLIDQALLEYQRDRVWTLLTSDDGVEVCFLWLFGMVLCWIAF
jgi:hypothetical protein